MDITQFFSDSTSELLQRAAQQAAEWGSLDLNTEHLLHSALQDESVRIHTKLVRLRIRYLNAIDLLQKLQADGPGSSVRLMGGI